MFGASLIMHDTSCDGLQGRDDFLHMHMRMHARSKNTICKLNVKNVRNTGLYYLDFMYFFAIAN